MSERLTVRVPLSPDSDEQPNPPVIVAGKSDRKDAKKRGERPTVTFKPRD